MWRWVLLLVLSMSTSTLQDCQQCNDSHVSLLPDDPVIEAGSAGVLTCIVNCSCQPSFTYGNDIPIPENQTSENPLQLRLLNQTSENTLQLWVLVNKTRNVTFMCNVGNGSAAQVLTVIDPPRQVTNWTAVVIPLETLNLTWQLTNDPDSVTVSTYWSDASGNGRNNCSSKSNFFCLLDEDQFFSSKEYHFTITVMNRLNNSYSAVTNLTVTTDKYVKADPVRSLEGKALNSTCVSLNWIAYSYDDRYQFVVSDGIRTYPANPNGTRVCSLRPYKLYRFCVHVAINGSIHISDKECYNVTTEQDRPSMGPTITAFSEDSCRDGRRNVYIYVNPPDEAHWNGELVGCNVTVSSINVSASNNACSPASPTVRTTRPCIGTANITVTVSTTIGDSPPAFLQLPVHSDRSPVFLGLLLTDDTATVYCESCGNWTMYWCRGSSRNCTEPFKSREVMSSWSTAPVNRSDVQNFLIGGSVNSHSLVSRIVWTLCSLDLSEDKVTVDVRSDERNTLLVGWYVPKANCTDLLVRNFSVECCHRANQECVETTAGRSEREVTIGQLEADAEYSVRVRYLTVDGQAGVWSDQGVAVVKGTDWKIWAVIGGSVVALFVVICILVIITRVRKKLHQNIVIETPTAPTPFDDQTPMDTNRDSGQGTSVSRWAPLCTDQDQPVSSACTSPTGSSPYSNSSGTESNNTATEDSPDYAQFHISTASADIDQSASLLKRKSKPVSEVNSKPDETLSMTENTSDSDREDFSGDVSACPYIFAGADNVEASPADIVVC